MSFILMLWLKWIAVISFDAVAVPLPCLLFQYHSWRSWMDGTWSQQAKGIDERTLPSAPITPTTPAMLALSLTSLWNHGATARPSHESSQAAHEFSLQLENEVKIDQVEIMVKLVETEVAPLVMDKEEFSYEFNINGFGLELAFMDPEKLDQAIMVLPTEPILPVKNVNHLSLWYLVDNSMLNIKKVLSKSLTFASVC
ncbi:hypothetical protein OG21DRAFT_1525082 [Imleria badia]|nr:hypothetical protein OG21DRAFT_1525082 [Imleria badia]